MNHRFYPHRINGRFYNCPKESKSMGINQSILMFFKLLWYRPSLSFNSHDWISTGKFKLDNNIPSIIWIGHSTFLIHINGITILTDPVFEDLTILYPRVTPPGISFENLPKIDLVIISHNHRDHMDIPSLKKIYNKFRSTILVPTGDKKLLESYGFSGVKEFGWWENIFIKDLEFSFLPAHHWTQRGIFDRNKSLWGSWMISSISSVSSVEKFNIYFGGDTAYSDHFKIIAKEFSSIDIALMPIGPCEPRDWFITTHIGPEEAIQGFLDLKAKHFMPMHWGSFNFGFDYFQMPIDRLRSAWQKEYKKLLTMQLHIVKLGEQKYFDISIPSTIFPEIAANL